MTNRQIIAEVRSVHRLLSSDAQLNDRSILAELRSTSLLLIKRETDRRKLFSSPNLFTTLPCLKMKQVPLAECCDYTSPRKISRSEQPLPKIAEGLFGMLIQTVNSVERTQKNYKESTPERYGNILRMNLSTKEVYYWIVNNYLYVSNPDLEAVSFSGFFEEDCPNSLLYPENCDCKPSLNVKNKCHSPLDEPFHAPGYLIDQIKQLVSKKLFETYFRIPADTTLDNTDSQTKTT